MMNASGLLSHGRVLLYLAAGIGGGCSVFAAISFATDISYKKPSNYSKHMFPFVGMGIASHTRCDYDADANADANADADADDLLRIALAPIRIHEKAIRAKWEADEENGSYNKLPPRAWPAYQPNADQLKELQTIVNTTCNSNIKSHSNSNSNVNSNKSEKEKEECEVATFNLATCLLFNTINPTLALQIYQTLSQQGQKHRKINIDAKVGVGIMLTEGLGVDCDEHEGIKYLLEAANQGSAQGNYELGTAIYTSGIVPPHAHADIDTDPDLVAFRYFEAAALQQHTGAMYMTGDMLLYGEHGKIPIDVIRGVNLLFAAAEKGHRYGRQEVRQLLDKTRR